MRGESSLRRRRRGGNGYGIFSFAYLIASWSTTGVLGDESNGASPATPLRVQDNVFHPFKGYDPVKDLCQRWYHQTVIANDTLYIDGGYWLDKGQVDGNKKVKDIMELQSMLGTM